MHQKVERLALRAVATRGEAGVRVSPGVPHSSVRACLVAARPNSGDGQVRLLKENGEKVRAFEGAGDFVNGVAATPDGRYVIGGGHYSVLRVWNGNDGKLVVSLGPGK